MAHHTKSWSPFVTHEAYCRPTLAVLARIYWAPPIGCIRIHVLLVGNTFRAVSLHYFRTHGSILPQNASKMLEIASLSFHRNCSTAKNIEHTDGLTCFPQAYTMWGHTLQADPANSEPVPLQWADSGGARRIALKPRSGMGCLEGARAVLP